MKYFNKNLIQENKELRPLKIFPMNVRTRSKMILVMIRFD